MTPSERKLSRILPKGYSTTRVGRGGHIRIVNPSGYIVRFIFGPKRGLPVSVSSSPGNDNWIREVIRDLKRAGITVRGSA
jgi:hypothetical protein